MSANQKNTLLVTGASGHVGRRVVEFLLESYTGTIIAATRTPEKLADISQRGVIVRHADFDNPDSLQQAFKDVDRLLLISTDALDVPGRRLTQHRNAIKAAEQAGVRHIVYTSIVNPDLDSPVFVVPDHHGTEETLAKTQMGWTILRENIYMDMLLMSLPRAIQTGQLMNAIGDGKAAYITREDCARASAAALAASFDGRRTVDITGPETVTQYQVAEIASRVSGKSISYLPLTAEALVDGMVAGGLPRPMAEGFASFDIGIAQGRLSTVSTGVEDLTGRKPIALADFLSTHRDVLVPIVS